MNIEEVKRKYLEYAVYRFLVKKQVDDINELFINEIKAQGIIPNCYSCQRCGNELVTETEVDIVPGMSPLCPGCLGNVTVTKEAVEEFIKERKNKECYICKSHLHLEESHDVPQYIGGQDSDGLRFLCQKHHREYDKFLLQEFLKSINEYPNLDYWKDIAKWQSTIKHTPQLHSKFRKIARKNIIKYFNNPELYSNKDIIHFCPYCKTEIDIEDDECPYCFKILNEVY